MGGMRVSRTHHRSICPPAVRPDRAVGHGGRTLRRLILSSFLLLFLPALSSTAPHPLRGSLARAAAPTFLPQTGEARAEIERFVDRVVASLVRKHRFFPADKTPGAVAGPAELRGRQKGSPRFSSVSYE